eukprot:gnl/MRDRNA2_/MRDRNA2_236025_c0_seq1.p1 gnl/MRDRNA2_/MRDRNA2_236025_c0~~gnl/MRDRNA2_/MRDRNA2_236025_c0_seq1.p1  ORF type:complete len:257 (+),score=40.03 gnl/MRDRNA2_/MRDRNA2_236025_c0_seq1:53-823(+)
MVAHSSTAASSHDIGTFPSALERQNTVATLTPLKPANPIPEIPEKNHGEIPENDHGASDKDPISHVAEDSKRPDLMLLHDWKQLQVDWQDTPLGPGYPTVVHSTWSDIGILSPGSVLRINADGFNGEGGPLSVWGWYLNVWSGDARHWDKKNSDASRLLHINPRARSGIVALNHCLKGGWGPQRDVPLPKAWRLENAASAFVLELELGSKAWSVKLNGEEQPKLAYKRKGDFSGPLTLQLYDVLNPRLSLKAGTQS